MKKFRLPDVVGLMEEFHRLSGQEFGEEELLEQRRSGESRAAFRRRMIRIATIKKQLNDCCSRHLIDRCLDRQRMVEQIRRSHPNWSRYYVAQRAAATLTKAGKPVSSKTVLRTTHDPGRPSPGGSAEEEWARALSRIFSPV